MGRGLSSRYTNAGDLPSWVNDVDPLQVERSKVTLKNALRQKYGDNTEAKVACLNRLKERVKNGLKKLSPVQAIALTEVLSDLVLNGKIKEANP